MTCHYLKFYVMHNSLCGNTTRHQPNIIYYRLATPLWTICQHLTRHCKTITISVATVIRLKWDYILSVQENVIQMLKHFLDFLSICVPPRAIIFISQIDRSMSKRMKISIFCAT